MAGAARPSRMLSSAHLPLTAAASVPTLRAVPPTERSSSGGQTPIGIELDGDGSHPAAWRLADHGPAELLSPARLGRTVRAAEAAGFSFATLAAARPGDG